MRYLSPILILAVGVAVGAGAARFWDRHLSPACADSPTVIIGDSNVVGMDLGPGCVNMGVGGDTSKRMATRFTAKDIAALGRRTLVIWTPSNEVHFQTEDGTRYIAVMARQARAAGMRVVLTTPLPMIDKSLNLDQAQVDAQVAALAAQVSALGRVGHFPVADLHAVTARPDGSPDRWQFRPDADGSVVHLNRSGMRAVWTVIAPPTK